MIHFKNKLKNIIYIFIVVIIMLLSSFLTACKSTPDKATVVQHDTEEFQNALMEKEKIPEERNFPTSYNDEFVSKDSRVKITVDAKVLIPDEKKIPVIRIKPSPISDDKVQWAVDEFMEGDEGIYPSKTMTKTEIESWILLYKSKLSNEEELYKKYKTEEEVKKGKKYLEEWIQNYNRMYINAPEENKKTPTNLMFRTYGFYTAFDPNVVENELNMSESELINRQNSCDENLYLLSDVKLSDGRYARLSVYNEYPYSISNTDSVFGAEYHQIHVVNSYVPLTIDSTYVLNYNPFSYYLPTIGCLDSRYPELTISKQEAINAAKSKLNSLEIDNFYIETVKKIKGLDYAEEYHEYYYQDEDNAMSEEKYFGGINTGKFYLITMRPEYYGIPLLDAELPFSNEELYNIPIEFEKIVIRVAQDSIAEFKWTNPTDISNVINDNVKIISMETAMENAKHFMKLKYILPTIAPVIPEMPNYEEILKTYTNANITIKEIKLGLGGIPAHNSPGEYLIIPVWNFYGSYSLSSTLDDYSFKPVDLDYPIVSVNAIDGSIISQANRLTH